jgi:hypothetical protein
VSEAPRITVVVAAYQPGDALSRVIDSLDAQTLPQEAFETIIVDDGSPDDTWARLQGYAATRPNLRVERIENSGWPSRPRNVATEAARGEYVLYMDHDDSLYPDALRRLAEFAAESGADVISPKESKTSDIWWGMPALAAGNALDVRADGAINRLLPMVPHKLYRREFLADAGIRFPEGRRMLWEDVYFNVEAYAKASRVGVLADTPVYLWHESGSNNSATYGATDEEFWDRLDNLLAFIDQTLAGPDLAAERRAMIMHQYQGRVIRRLGRALQEADAGAAAVAMQRARAVQEAYVPEEWDARLGFFIQPLARFLREGRPDLIRLLHAAYLDIGARTELTSLAWTDGVLAVDTTTGWRHKSGGPVLFDRVDDRLRLRVPPEVAAALPAEALDVTDRTGRLSLTMGVRSRVECVTWQLPSTGEVSVDSAADGFTVAVRASGRLDPLVAGGGRRLDATVWDFSTVARWDGIPRVSPIRTTAPPASALVSGLPAVAYATRSGALALDLSQRLRTPAADGVARDLPGGFTATPTGFVLPLPEVHVSGRTELPVEVLATRRGGSSSGVVLPATLIGDEGGARVEMTGTLPPGRHRLAFRTPEGTVASPLVVDPATGSVTVSPTPGTTGLGAITGGLRRLGRALVRLRDRMFRHR